MWNGQSVSLTKNQSRNLPERDKMKKEELNEYGYPINKDSDKKIRQGMDLERGLDLF